MDWTARKAEEAENVLRRWAAVVGDWKPENVDDEFLECLANDLNVKAGFDRLHELYEEDNRASLSACLALVGIDPVRLAEAIWARQVKIESPDGKITLDGHDFQPSVSVISWGELPDEVREKALHIVRKWMALRRLRNWSAADALKESAAEFGLELRATKSDSGSDVGIGTMRRRIVANDIAELEGLL
jgi:cysteinyl-tRNA synthetase